MLKIYLAGAISGRGYEEVTDYFSRTADLLSGFFEVMHPMLGKEALRNEIEFKAFGYGNPESTNHAIIERDFWMVNWADVIYLNLFGAQRVSIGSMMELAWAYNLRKLAVTVMELKNIHRHAFVLEASDAVFESEAGALNYLISLARGKNSQSS